MSRDQGTVSASPTKDFFVKMLVRDIDLPDAILDLLDNCIDGAIRATKAKADSPERYAGFWAKLVFANGKFSIEDNCGGIKPELADHAFMMGRPDLERDSDIPTVGMYGIGMKRALFKMGRSSRVISQTDEETFVVRISPDWLVDAANWDLPYEAIQAQFEENGTLIEIEELYPGVQKEFFGEGARYFLDELKKAIATHYCFIAHKGFEFFLNGEKIEPWPLTVLFDTDEGQGIHPYVYEGEFEQVKVFLVVGFAGPTPTEDEVEENLEQPRRSSEDAGWTIICNDRVVVYKDKTRLTGWGVGGVPAYHTQFITISGVVEFKSNHAESLPITTTKRGIDAASDLFLRVRDYMMEGMKLFTNHTNVWKKQKIEESDLFQRAKSYDVREVSKLVPEGSWKQVRGGEKERKYMPSLPKPKQTDDIRQIKFNRPSKDVRIVSKFLFEDPAVRPSEVGAECFDTVLRLAKKER
jgi:hypothetical protein